MLTIHFYLTDFSTPEPMTKRVELLMSFKYYDKVVRAFDKGDTMHILESIERQSLVAATAASSRMQVSNVSHENS
jgi:hypothetical protein